MYILKRSKTYYLYNKSLPGSHCKSLKTKSTKTAQEMMDLLLLERYKNKLGLKTEHIEINTNINKFEN